MHMLSTNIALSGLTEIFKKHVDKCGKVVEK